MAQFFHLLSHIANTTLFTPWGLALTFLVVFTGEIGVSPPFYMEAAWVAAGVKLSHGGLEGLVLFPLVVVATLLGVWACYYGVTHSARLLRRYLPKKESPRLERMADRLRDASAMHVAVVRQLPASQLPVTAVWAAIRGPLAVFLLGAGISVVMRGVTQMLLGVLAGRASFAQSEAAQFWWGMGFATAAGLCVIAAGFVVQRLQHSRQGGLKESPGLSTIPPQS